LVIIALDIIHYLTIFPSSMGWSKARSIYEWIILTTLCQPYVTLFELSAMFMANTICRRHDHIIVAWWLVHVQERVMQ